jgi:hypothetical protein
MVYGIVKDATGFVSKNDEQHPIFSVFFTTKTAHRF